MNPLETYLQNLYVIHSSGSAVKETSYYGTLENLFNEVGKSLKPKVRCIINIQNLTDEEALAHLGERTRDGYLNDVALWKNIPERVWDHTIGGYQVIKKWLSYRELELLGRPLTPEEAREVMNMARRIGAIVLLEPALDANYQAVKADTYSWPSPL